MTTRERIIIYSLLAALVLVNLPGIIGATTRTALAAAHVLAETLGPAEAVILQGADDEEPLTLRNSDGRPSWADTAYARAHSVAFVHIGKAIDGITQQDAYIEEREQLEDEIETRDEELRGRINAFQQEHGSMTAEDPNAQAIAQQAVALQREYEQWMHERARQMGELTAQQLERAYREVIAAVEIVARRESIDIVYRFIPTDDEFEARSPDQALTAIWSRIALTYPEALDITDQVMAELALPVE